MQCTKNNQYLIIPEGILEDKKFMIRNERERQKNGIIQWRNGKFWMVISLMVFHKVTARSQTALIYAWNSLVLKHQLYKKVSYIRGTLNLLLCGDSSTDTKQVFSALYHIELHWMVLNFVQCSVVHNSAGQFCAVQCSSVQCSAKQCSAVQCSAVQYLQYTQCMQFTQCSSVQCSAVHCSPFIYYTV